jgi:Pyruvate/2-oxoacid:ferredoxin oxidoreductase delta subunit
MIPKGLRTWFIIHFVADYLSGIPLLFAPVWTMSLLGWTTIDPATSRLVGRRYHRHSSKYFPGRAPDELGNPGYFWCVLRNLDLLPLPTTRIGMKIMNRPQHPSRSFFQTAKEIPNFSLFDKLHGYVYLRWPYLYIGVAKGDHPLSKIIKPVVKIISWFFPPPDTEDPNRNAFAEGYHGKVVPTDAAKQLVTVQEDICIPDLEQVIPYEKARSIIMVNPDHIVALECPCRSSRDNPCLPLDVCLVIGEPFASFVIEHHPRRARWVDQNEAVEILEAERDRGHVSHAFFKDAMLERFYAICNCCECCCGAMQAHRSGTPMLASSGYFAQVNKNQCKACGECSQYCQFGAIQTMDDYSKINPEMCMGCGVCVSHCKQEAISLAIDERKGIPLEIHKLLADAVY